MEHRKALKALSAQLSDPADEDLASQDTEEPIVYHGNNPENSNNFNKAKHKLFYL